MQNKTNARPSLVWLLIALLGLLAVGALAGGGALFLAPDGRLMGMPLALLQGTPFTSYAIPGALLFTCVGVYPLAVAYSLWARPGWRWPDTFNPFKRFHWALAASLAAGVIDVIWISVQIILVGYQGLIQSFYFVWGLIIISLTLAPGIRGYCRRKG